MSVSEYETDEAIIRPNYYRAVRANVNVCDTADVMDVNDAFQLPYNIGLAFKHMVRGGRKAGENAVQDLEKAIEALKRQRDFEANRENFR